MSFADKILEQVDRIADQPAVIIDDRVVSYEQLRLHIFSVASAVSKQSERGDRILVHATDKLAYLVAILGCGASHRIAVPLDTNATSRTVASIAADCQPRAILHDGSEGSLAIAEGDLKLIPIDGPQSSSVPASAPVDPSETATIMYTSGTTGTPKAVMLSHGNLTSAVDNINRFMQVDDSIREYVSVPFSHSFGWGRARCVLSVGGTIIVNNGDFRPAALIQQVERHAGNAISWVPAGYLLANRHLGKFFPKIADNIRWMELGSAFLSATDKQRLTETFPNARICMHYGLTEASRSTFLEFHDRAKLQSVGKPSPGVELEIRDEHNEVLPPGPSHGGRICVRGGHAARHYWKNDHQHVEIFGADGFLDTGDFGYLDEDGYLFLAGRHDEMINTGGLKVAPAEIERAIAALYPELDCAVIGVPDPDGICGSIPAMCYVGDGQPIQQQHLVDQLSSHLETFKIPRLVCQVAAIPRTANGKVQRTQLRQLVSVAGEED